jgi:hypothetical protein
LEIDIDENDAAKGIYPKLSISELKVTSSNQQRGHMPHIYSALLHDVIVN